ncbi:MAG: aminopeptidase P family protein [Lachnospiraceae bacterium]|nr:aminopeptidase P family protein [Lachnospiraceae bacterium]
MIQKRLKALRELMKRENVQAYIVCTDDFHGSEYVGKFFKVRAFLSGFTGSAGTLVVLEKEAALWTDGRYFLQAGQQLAGSTITLMKAGQEGVPEIEEYLKDKLGKGDGIGFDGRTVTTAFVEKITKPLADKEIRIVWDKDLAGEVWEDRPALSKEPVWELDLKYAGESRPDKLKRVREKIAEREADLFVLTSLDDIAWLLNLRGNDVACNPVFLSYMLIEKDRAVLYAQKEAFDEKLRGRLEQDGVSFREYEQIYEDLQKLEKGKSILLDADKVNYKIRMCIGSGQKLIEQISPVFLLKAVKNATECEGMKQAHIKDGVAVTRFMYWLKAAIKTETITEISAAEKLESFRKEQEGYMGPSFEPIMAYGAHGAIVHYSATEESNIELKPEGLFLSDTGGQYPQGTTDITRTYALGELTAEEKRDYTLVMLGNLRLAAVKFLHGTRGVNLDFVAREPLWEYGLDYNHGTGHGVGFFLNVHEGPNAFRIKLMKREEENAVFEAGMITSDEPGIYITDKFGVRLENLILCKESEKTEYGKFLCFETLTMVPFDLDAVDTSYMNERDIRLLNEYHAKVYETISPYLSEEEKNWLKEATRAIGR